MRSIPVPLWLPDIPAVPAQKLGASTLIKAVMPPEKNGTMEKSSMFLSCSDPAGFPLRTAWITPASAVDLPAAKQINFDCRPIAHGALFTDKACRDADWDDSMSRSCRVNILTPGKKKPYDTFLSGDCCNTCLSALRQPVESFFHWADFHAHIQFASFARSLHDLFSHIFASLALFYY